MKDVCNICLLVCVVYDAAGTRGVLLTCCTKPYINLGISRNRSETVPVEFWSAPISETCIVYISVLIARASSLLPFAEALRHVHV